MLGVVITTGEGAHVVQPVRPAPPRASPAAASAALAAFVTAVDGPAGPDGPDGADAEALGALAPPDDAAATALLAEIAGNVRSLRLDAVTARYVDQVGAIGADGRWSGRVELTWQLRGFDRRPSSTEVVVTFAPTADGLGISAFGAVGAAASRTPLWLRGRLSVVRRSGVLVMVDGGTAAARTVAARARRGVEVVRRVLPRWRGRAVIEVPASGADLDEVLGVGTGTYADVAGVTVAAGQGTGADAPVHVFVNPDVIDGGGRSGALVMAHELTHLATGDARAQVEPWLREGFADYVAMRGVRLPERVALARAVRLARRDGVPRSLPDEADFATSSTDLQARYQQAWLACEVLADRLGERGLVAVHHAAMRGAAVDRVLEQRGLPVATVTRVWRSRLAALAG